jgi:hypothetical protein
MSSENTAESDKKPNEGQKFVFQKEVSGSVFTIGEQSGIVSTGPNAHISQVRNESSAQVTDILKELRLLLEQARGKGAEGADCESAGKALEEIGDAVAVPDDPKSKEKAEGALKILENTGKALGGFVEIAEKFGRLLVLLQPALIALFR